MADPVIQARCPCCGAPISPADVLFDEAHRYVVHSGSVVMLTPREAEVFARLLKSAPLVVAAESIFAAIYAGRVDGGPEYKNIDIFVCRLRRKLKPLGLVIETIWGTGYRLTIADPAQADAIKAASLRARGETFRWSPGLDADVLDLHRRGYRGCQQIATKLGTPFRATWRAMERLGLSSPQKERLHA